MKPIRWLRVPTEWERALRTHPNPNSSPRRWHRWPFYLLVTALTALIVAGALEQYFPQL